MQDLCYKKGDGFLMVYSVTDSSSLEDVKDGYQSMLESTVSQNFYEIMSYTKVTKAEISICSLQIANVSELYNPNL